MGVGDPADLVACVGLGVDMFDCVMPTRMARNGALLTKHGRMNIRNARNTPKTPHRSRKDCACLTCRRYSRAYLRHLFMARELLAYRLNTIHNLHYILNLMAQMREAIQEQSISKPSRVVSWPIPPGRPLWRRLITKEETMFDLFTAKIAWAMGGAPGGGGGAGGLGGMLSGPLPMLILMFAIFYFLLIRPQQKKAKAHREMLNNLRKGDSVMTSGGVFGRVTGLDNQVVVVEIAPQVRVKVNRASISGVVTAQQPAPPAKDKK